MFFFTTLAEQYQEKAIGILLSGNPPDGTLGLKAIKAAGGITFAQDQSALFGGMTDGAIAEEAVDMVLTPTRIAEELGILSTRQEAYYTALKEIKEESISQKDENLTLIFKNILRHTKVDFSFYKINTVKRRIIRRMVLLKMDQLSDYASYLQQHSNEVHQLYQDLLINVTSFFRDPDIVQQLSTDILPRILKNKTNGEALRIWVPACSTGQEAYSLAMLILEAVEKLEVRKSLSIQIFATDLSERSVNKARLGLYNKDEVVEIPERMLTKYFTRHENSYRIQKNIRDLCIFAVHNALTDPPFLRLDMISCSNLLIYLDPVLQKKLMATYHYSLNGIGFLILGKSETIGNSGYLFAQPDKKIKIYTKKKEVVASAHFELSYRQREKSGEAAGNFQPKILAHLKQDENELDKMVEQTLLKKYTPACVVVNQDLDIIQFRGSTGLFLEPAPGKASLNLMKMARAGLGFELRNIILKSSKSGQNEVKTWMESVTPVKSRKMTIESIPIKNESEKLDKYFLVIFEVEEVDLEEPSPANIAKEQRVQQLEDELNSLKEDMRAVIEEQEAANEELQSVNEEIVSSNEELQSINEELETSKEELESSNEELITINQEMQMRNEQLAEIQEYSEAVFTTIRESLLILDKNLRIKNANTVFYRTFQVTEEETQGKLLYDVGNGQWNIPKLKVLLEEVIPQNTIMNDFEVTHTFPGIGEKIMILNARRLVQKLHGEHLILLALEDITQYRKAIHIIQKSEDWFHSMAENSPMMIWVTDTDKKVKFVNQAWLEYRNEKPDHVIGGSWIEDMHPEDINRVQKIFDESFIKKKEFTVQYRLKKEGQYHPVLSKGKPNFSHDGHFTGYIGSCVEIPDTFLITHD
ncbi:MAG TPA: CheR family methyltransferase [Chitinophagaceae bacterium]|nr:CheR family methyltransferase [Chitinophagaceae bacterium]